MSIDWFGLLRLALLWLVVVFLALRALDLLFPRLRRDDGEAPAPGNSVLAEFTLTAEGDERTRLRVTETGLDDTDWPDDDKLSFAEDHRQGWDFHLGRLCTLPGPDPG